MLCVVSLIDIFMMTSSNGNIFRVTDPLCGEFTCYRWVPLTKTSDTELWCFLWPAPEKNGCINNDKAGDLRRHRALHDVTVMFCATVTVESALWYLMTCLSARSMLASSNGVTGPWCGEFTGQRRVPPTKDSDMELWCVSLICGWTNGWVNNRDTADWDVIAIIMTSL